MSDIVVVALLGAALAVGARLYFNRRARLKESADSRQQRIREFQELLKEIKTGAKHDIEEYRRRRDEYRNRYNVVIPGEGDDDSAK